MKILGVKVICILVIAGCSNNHKGKIEKKIEEKIIATCQENKECKIDLKTILPFEFDSLIVFKETATVNEINKVLGKEYPYFEDIARRLVFLKNNEIVYHEDIFPNVETVENGQVVFSIPDTLNYRTFVRSEYMVKNVSFKGGTYYLLETTGN